MFVCWLTSGLALITHPGIHSPPLRRLSPSSAVFSQHSAQSQRGACPEEVSGLVQSRMERQQVTSRSSLILLSHTSHLTSYSVTEPGHGRTDGMADRRVDVQVSGPRALPLSAVCRPRPLLSFLPPFRGKGGRAKREVPAGYVCLPAGVPGPLLCPQHFLTAWNRDPALRWLRGRGQPPQQCPGIRQHPVPCSFCQLSPQIQALPKFLG